MFGFFLWKQLLLKLGISTREIAKRPMEQAVFFADHNLLSLQFQKEFLAILARITKFILIGKHCNSLNFSGASRLFYQKMEPVRIVFQF